MHRPELPAYALAGLLVAAIAALAGIHVTVPTVLPYALLGVLGVAGGVSLPLFGRNEPLSGTQDAQLPAPGVIPAPQPLTAPVLPVTPVTDVTAQTATPASLAAVPAPVPPPPPPPAAG